MACQQSADVASAVLYHAAKAGLWSINLGEYDEDRIEQTGDDGGDDEHKSAIFYDSDAIEERINSLLSAFNFHFQEPSPPKPYSSSSLSSSSASLCSSSLFLHAFAVKACPVQGVLEVVRNNGMGAECASIAEVWHSLTCGFAPSKIIFDSPCKTRGELRKAIEWGVHFNADNFEELRRIDVLLRVYRCKDIDDVRSKKDCEKINSSNSHYHHHNHQNKKKPIRLIGLRINPQVGVGSIASSSTAATDSKFGVGLQTNYQDILHAFRCYPWLNTVHMHTGSQGCDLALLTSAIERLSSLLSAIVQQQHNLICCGENKTTITATTGVMERVESGSKGLMLEEDFRSTIREIMRTAIVLFRSILTRER